MEIISGINTSPYFMVIFSLSPSLNPELDLQHVKFQCAEMAEINPELDQQHVKFQCAEMAEINKELDLQHVKFQCAEMAEINPELDLQHVKFYIQRAEAAEINPELDLQHVKFYSMQRWHKFLREFLIILPCNCELHINKYTLNYPLHVELYH